LINISYYINALYNYIIITLCIVSIDLDTVRRYLHTPTYRPCMSWLFDVRTTTTYRYIHSTITKSCQYELVRYVCVLYAICTFEMVDNTS